MYLSSANNLKAIISIDRLLNRLEKKTGPKIDTCGTLVLTGKHSDA